LIVLIVPGQIIWPVLGYKSDGFAEVEQRYDEPFEAGITTKYWL